MGMRDESLAGVGQKKLNRASLGSVLVSCRTVRKIGCIFHGGGCTRGSIVAAMTSQELLREVIENAGTKKVAFDLRVSSSLVYKWCAVPESASTDGARSVRNPLDRVLGISNSARSRRLIEWLCGEVGGYFVENPDSEPEEVNIEYMQETQELLEHFSKLLQSISRAVVDDGNIDTKEALQIREEWRELQSHGEAFVRACEMGFFERSR